MLEERELLAMIMALVIFLYFSANRGKLTSVPHLRILAASFVLLAASLVCSVLEVLFWEDVINFVQHALMPAAVVLLAIWSWLTLVRRGVGPA